MIYGKTKNHAFWSCLLVSSLVILATPHATLGLLRSLRVTRTVGDHCPKKCAARLNLRIPAPTTLTLRATDFVGRAAV